MVALLYPLVFILGLALESIEEGLWILGISSLVVGLSVWFLSSGVWALVTGSCSPLAAEPAAFV